MDAQTCLKKLEYVGVLNFATVGLDGTPQIRCISAIHYEPEKLYFFTARGKDFCRELIFQEQPYLKNVYPGKTREIGIVFVIRDMQIEYFNLGVNPIFREQYLVGNGVSKPKGYEITSHCIGCGTCVNGCPQRCIKPGNPYYITQENCLHCGNCFEHCPVKAIRQL